jgi:hypothetical protein
MCGVNERELASDWGKVNEVFGRELVGGGSWTAKGSNATVGEDRFITGSFCVPQAWSAPVGIK